MASATNWLGFSLSPQEHRLNLAAGDSSSSAAAAAAAFNFSNQIADGSFTLPEDCNFKENPSELSMVVGSRRNEEESSPKLEDFLGGNFSGHSQKLPPGCRSMTWTFDNTANSVYSNYSLKEVSESENNVGKDCSIGLSMIKTWLRTQPEAAPPLPGGGGSDSGSAAKSQSLSLSMSSSSAEEKRETSVEAGPRRGVDSLGHRTSIYRGVTRHRWTGRYEAHLWDNSCRREGQTRKGRQVYLGGYDKEEKAAIAYDLAALKYWGTMTTTNFPISNYRRELDEMRHMTRQEYVASLRRKSSGFSRGASIYRGVTRHHQQGRWQARIGRVAGNKDLYLGTFSTQEEAAEAYDIAAIKFRGLNAVTNFDMNRYDVKSIMESNTLPIGAPGKHPNDDPAINPRTSDVHEGATSLTPGINGSNYISWSGIPLNPPPITYPHIQLHDQDTLRTLRDLHHYQTGSAANRFLPPPPPAAVSLNSCPAIYGGEGFLGDNGLDFPSSRPFSCRNIYTISEQSPGGEAGGSSLPVCYGGPVFSVWNDS